MNNPITDRDTNVWGYVSRRIVLGGSERFVGSHSRISYQSTNEYGIVNIRQPRGFKPPSLKHIQTGFRICRSKT